MELILWGDVYFFKHKNALRSAAQDPAQWDPGLLQSSEIQREN